MAAKGDEVELAGLLSAFEAQGHGGILAGVGKAVRAFHPSEQVRWGPRTSLE